MKLNQIFEIIPQNLVNVGPSHPRCCRIYHEVVNFNVLSRSFFLLLAEMMGFQSFGDNIPEILEINSTYYRQVKYRRAIWGNVEVSSCVSDLR